jgi:hypothetical protein
LEDDTLGSRVWLKHHQLGAETLSVSPQPLTSNL